jgi:hypothetical protein
MAITCSNRDLGSLWFEQWHGFYEVQPIENCEWLFLIAFKHYAILSSHDRPCIYVLNDYTFINIKGLGINESNDVNECTQHR